MARIQALSEPDGVRRTEKIKNFTDFFSVSYTPVDLLMAHSLAITHPAFVSLSSALSSLFFTADGGNKLFQNVSKLLQDYTVSHRRRQHFPVHV